MRRSVWAGVAVVGALVLAGCTGDDGDPAAAGSGSPGPTPIATSTFSYPSPPPYSPPPPPPVSAAAPDTELDLPEDMYDYLEVCRGAKYAGAARYAGAGPHPIQFSNATQDAPRGIDDLEAPDSVIDRWEGTDVRKIQLVACVTMTKGAAAARCRYIGKPPVTMFSRTYRVVMREARTGRQVGRTLTARGEDLECAELVLAKPDGSLNPQYSGITARQLRSLFTDLYAGPAR